MQVSRRLAFFFLCFGSLITAFNVSAINAVIPSMSKGLGLSDLDVARMVPYYMIPYGIGALMYAPLSRKFSVRAILILSIALYGITNLVCGLTSSLNVILIARVIKGLAAASIMPLGLMVIGKIFEREVRGRMVGTFFSASFVGAAMGLIISGVAPWHWIFIVPGILGLVCSLGMLVMKPYGFERLEGVHTNYFKILQLANIKRILIFIFCISLLFNGVAKWYGVYLAREYHYNQMMVSSLILLTAVVSILGQLLGGYLTDKKGRVFTSFFGVVMLGLMVMLLYGHYPLWTLVILLSLVSIGWTVGHNGISTVLTDFSDDHRSEIASLNSSVRFLSGGIGFYLSGRFVEHNFNVTFLVIGLIILGMSVFVKRVVASD